MSLVRLACPHCPKWVMVPLGAKASHDCPKAKRAVELKEKK